MPTDIDWADSINELIKDTWTAATPLRTGAPTFRDALKARYLAKQLDKTLKRYEECHGDCVPKTTVWLAKETVAAVHDLTGNRK